MMKISKELLSAVLNFEVSYVYVAPNGKFIEAQSENRDERVNIYELAFRTKEYLKTKSKHLSLNPSINDIFKKANSIYESLSNEKVTGIQQ